MDLGTHSRGREVSLQHVRGYNTRFGKDAEAHKAIWLEFTSTVWAVKLGISELIL